MLSLNTACACAERGIKIKHASYTITIKEKKSIMSYSYEAPLGHQIRILKTTD